MKKVYIVFDSRTGTTKKYGEQIGKYIGEKGMEASLCSIKEYDGTILDKADIVLLGCWTNGLMFFAQHPNKDWIKFANKLPDMENKIVGLFTTYTWQQEACFVK